MITIHKYRLFFGVGVEMPKGAIILSVQFENNVGFVAFAMVDTDKPFESRQFTKIETGEEITANDVKFLKYFSTIENGPHTWHIFEVKQ